VKKNANKKRISIILSLLIILGSTIFLFFSINGIENPGEKYIPIISSEKQKITWDYVLNCAEHGFNGLINLTKSYGKYNLSPGYDLNEGASDWLYPKILPAAISIYKITHDKKYLNYAKDCADEIEKQMLNEKNIIRMYSFKNGPSTSQPTDLNFYILPYIAELAIYDSTYQNLSEKVARAIIYYGLSKSNIPYNKIYPNGEVAESNTALPSNSGTLSITIIGLLRTYEATKDQAFLNKSYDVLTSVWNNKKTSYNLIPTIFNADSLKTVDKNTQLYATGELLKAYTYYYYLTHNETIKNIISKYATAAYNAYWHTTDDDHGYFVYEVDVENKETYSNVLEANWHKLDMSLIYAGEILDKTFTDRIYEDMNTYWLKRGLVYKSYLFRHGTNPDGTASWNKQSLIYSSLRTANYVMLRMLNDGNFIPSDKTWNSKIFNHIDALKFYHSHDYGYHTDVCVDLYKPDEEYYGLKVIPACGEFTSLIVLLFNTTPNVEIIWEEFDFDDYILEPFSTDYSAEILGFMSNVFMDYQNKEIAFKKIKSIGEGRVFFTHNITEVRVDEEMYFDWDNNYINVIDGVHEYIVVFEDGSYVKPDYPLKSNI